ncbi:exodeoxyribonuclease III [Changpingibacter yushuensis]|uniref:exodeoxyribonuclease III n=1 Tax=Changpingibacter yushuensis TaxID=2758440 RepID=UPI0015F422C0|nr:exodeoxyribonuclease III [Changpingibacter yushuensis]
MRIATWNINSIRARADRALEVLNRWDLDVLLLQETKCKPEQFPRAAFEAAGYEVAAHGLNQWNGVAIVSRVGIADVRTSFDGQPGFAKAPADGSIATPVIEARAIGATCGGIDLWSLYIPNGRAVGDPHYAYKLEFLSALNRTAAGWLAANPDLQLLMGGDWNVAPRDTDVWDKDFFDDGLYVSEPERAAFLAFGESGLQEVTRQADGATYTFWDYQQLRFPKNEGMRIDFAWTSPALAQRVTAAHIDRNERKGKGASDHVPVVVEIDD